MKKIFLFISNFSFTQEKFTLEVDAPLHINEKIILSPARIRKGFENFYMYNLDTSKNVVDFGKRFGFKNSAYQISMQNINVLKGDYLYTIPLTFQFFNPVTKSVNITKPFYLDSGNYRIQLPQEINHFEIKINSPINNEYTLFKDKFSDLYKSSQNSIIDSLTDLVEKQKRISWYIKDNPNSYVAFWEIINDYTLYNFNHIYLENLDLFSGNIKKTDLFIKFKEKLEAEYATISGKIIPDFNFDKQNPLTRDNFKKYKLTLIDCWTTTCSPCIRALPKLVEMYDKYKKKGVNFITITEENEEDRIKLAKKILSKNKVKWQIFFDTQKDFLNKINVTVYPLYLLIDSEGKIVFRFSGNLKQIELQIDKFIY